MKTIVLIDYQQPLKARKESRTRVGPYTWTPCASGGGRSFYQSPRELAMDSHGSAFRLRLEEADRYLSGSRLHGTTYYCDSDGAGGYLAEGSTLTPIIALLPHGRGFLPGWTMGGGMLGAIDCDDIRDTPEDAALAAHDMAERDGERNAEWQWREEEREREQEAESEALTEWLMG